MFSFENKMRMTMFDWLAKAGSPIILEGFWIYWATAVLSIFVILCVSSDFGGTLITRKSNFKAQRTL